MALIRESSVRNTPHGPPSHVHPWRKLSAPRVCCKPDRLGSNRRATWAKIIDPDSTAVCPVAYRNHPPLFRPSAAGSDFRGTIKPETFPGCPAMRPSLATCGCTRCTSPLQYASSASCPIRPVMSLSAARYSSPARRHLWAGLAMC